MNEITSRIVFPPTNEDFEPVPFKGWRPYQQTHEDYMGAKQRLREAARSQHRGDGPQANPLRVPREDVAALLDYIQMIENLLQSAAMEKVTCP